jgi:MbtH protein
MASRMSTSISVIGLFEEVAVMAWEEDENLIYTVVVNHEEQYSIWPEYKNIPNGWRAVGKTGLKADCLAYIKEAWTDMRPLSLRKQMEEAQAARNA